MFKVLEEINNRPRPFEFYTAKELWTDDHTSKQMLAFHLNGEIDVSSRNTAFIDRSVDWIKSKFNIGAGFKIADFGCGPGLYASRLAKKGAHVTGIDFSWRSIEYAKQAVEKDGLTIRYENQDYLEFETDERFDLIIMIMCDFCALGPDQREIMLKKFRRLLLPEGHILLDVYSLNAYKLREEGASYEANQLNGFWSPDKYYGFLNTFKYEEEEVVLDKYTIVDEARTRTVYNWLQYFSPESLEFELAKCGFHVLQFLGDVAGSPMDSDSSEFAVVAKVAAGS